MSESFCIVAEYEGKKLFAMAFPGLVRPLEDDLNVLRDNNIGSIVTLTWSPLLLPLPYRPFFRQLHLPIEEFSPPTLDQVIAFVDFVYEEFEREVNVVVHCFAGIGRAGTMAASFRVNLGEDPDHAIKSLRAIRHFIETPDQEEIVITYANYLKTNK